MPPSKNAYLLSALVSEVDSLACGIARKAFPVLLRPIAERRRVTSIRFCPLLVDAMLTTHPEGFGILLNSDDGKEKELTEVYLNESKGRMLPSRLRFSLAHELAHTFFYDLSKTTPKLAKRFTSGGGRTELENLERHCNTLAAHLLLPTPIFAAEFLDLKAITPEAVLDVARKAGVSLQAFLWRLNQSDSLFVQSYFRGCIVLITQGKVGLEIKAIAKPQSLNIAHSLLQMRSGDSWKLQSLDGAEINPMMLPPISNATFDVRTDRAKNPKQYKICVAEAGQFEERKSFLVTFEEKRVR